MPKKRNTKLKGKHLLIISSIVMLNTLGVGYAQWSDDLKIHTTLTMGNIDPVFCSENYRIEVIRDGQGNEQENEPSTLSNLKVEFQDDNHTMFITGELEEGYKAFILYCVYNDGTLPIKYNQSLSQQGQHNEFIIQDGLKLEITQASDKLEPGEKAFSESGNSNPKIDIQIAAEPAAQTPENNQEPSSHFFELKLPFDLMVLATGGYGNWQKDLTIKGNITVVKPLAVEQIEPINEEQELNSENNELSEIEENTHIESIEGESISQTQETLGIAK